ncbi:hypothetical protein M408DRAFT_331323 [Serendipita vermifera MAFF 305830]|uniref:RRM domain-containing protein n=1 Tax=Serendipita vermifera MAFF 305830 TaxID=933852 RepID=A0A0C3AZ31_SERVB|nr:hypothetical protein M408DRAFT_331323 [Serendipita vermifera MAFF 305830]
MDPDNFSLVIDYEEDSDWDEYDDDEHNPVTAATLEGELISLKSREKRSHEELDGLRMQQSYFDPMYPPPVGQYVEEINERDLQGSIRACEYRIRRLQAQIGNLNRRVISAKRAEASGLNVNHVLSIDERTLFVLGMGNQHCHPEVAKSMFKVYGDVEGLISHKYHCLVTFASRESANKALVINGSSPFGRRLRVRPKLEPYSFSTMPLTISFLEAPSFSFPFTFCVPRSPSPTGSL